MPKQYPENTRSVLLTNVNDTGDDVLVFTTLTAAEIEATYKPTPITFDECYEIPEKDQSLYIWEPCWLTIAEEAKAREMIAQAAEQLSLHA